MATPTPQKRTIAALDVPAAQVEAEIRDRRQMRLKDLALDAQLAEQRHQYLDLDADSVCCPAGFYCPACPPNTTPGETS